MEEENELIDRLIPEKGEGAEQLLELINNESPLDEYLREKRDFERELSFIKERINTSLETIKETLEWIDHAFMRIDEAYRKQINGSSEENNIHIS